MYTLIISLLVLGVLVTVHEGGHFLMARWCGITVEKFSIGFGKAIFKKKYKGVEYSLSWIPLGGYVKMKGDNPDDNCADADSFYSSVWWKRALIAFAGPFTNLLFAIIVMIISFLFPQHITDVSPVVDRVNGVFTEYFQKGDVIKKVNDDVVIGWNNMLSKLEYTGSNEVIIERDGVKKSVQLPVIPLSTWIDYQQISPYLSAEIGDVIPKSPAYNAGLEKGDKIVEVDGKVVNNWIEMTTAIKKNKNDVILKIRKSDNRLETKTLGKMELPNSEQKLIGITQKMSVDYSESYGLIDAVKYGFMYTFTGVVANYVGIYQLIKKPSTIKNSIGGPVMILTTGRDFAAKGFAKVLQFIGMLNIILMVMNLLPIPVLDGGHIVFSIIEGVRGKALSIKSQMVLQQIGLFLLLFLMVYAFYSDFNGLFNRYIRN